jgi:polysaccharide pyruvyl transferase CsaB
LKSSIVGTQNWRQTLGRIAVHGFYGMGNLGDEAILKAMLNEIKNKISMEIVVFSRKPEQVQKDHNVMSISSETKGDLFKRRKELKRCDLFILGGGGLLKDFGQDSSSLKKWLKLLNLAQKYRCKTALFAVGVENIRFEESRSMLRNTLANVDVITVRDKYSKDILDDIGVRNTIKVTTDPVVLLGHESRGRKTNSETLKDSQNTIAVCVRQWFDKGFYIEDPKVNENLIITLAKTADFLVNNYNTKIEFIPMRTISYDDDRKMARQILTKMKFKDNVKIYDDVPDIDRFVQMLGQYSLLIGMRLHSLILGSAVGLPVIGLNYMPKVKGYMDSIDQAKCSLDLDTITADKMIKLIEDTYSEYGSRCSSIKNEVKRLQKIAKENILEILKLAN